MTGQRLHVVQIGCVGRQNLDIGRQRFPRLRDTSFAAAGNEHFRALGVEQLRRRQSDPRRASRNQGYFVLQLAHLNLLYWNDQSTSDKKISVAQSGQRDFNDVVEHLSVARGLGRYR